MPNITPVLLAGGSGTRLWPLSRKSYPKQFSQLMGKETLFQSSVRRLSKGVFLPPMILTHSDFRFIVTEQLAEAGVDPGAILIEPDGRNTAPAVLAAALYAMQSDPDAILLVAPSDHVLKDNDAFVAAVQAGLSAVADGKIVTFGIKPNAAKMVYGYLEVDSSSDGQSATPVKSFVEKPDADGAERMLAAGNYLWNSGIFLFAAKDIVKSFEAYAPNIVAPVGKAISDAKPDLGFLRLDPTAWDEVEDISIDYAVMEKADNLSVVPLGGDWTDLGGWDAVWSESGPDADGVAMSGPATAIDCHNTLLRSESDSQQIVGLGLDNIIAIAMPDAVLIADQSRSHDVALAVTALIEKDVVQARQFPRDHRPWGWFESLVVGNRFQVKRIVVHPGAALSLQSHVHRSEHWIVVEGTARVTVDDDVKLVTENQSVYIPLGAVHRMENPGKVPMVLIEVQTGAYVGEDDIVRYEDVYARD